MVCHIENFGHNFHYEKLIWTSWILNNEIHNVFKIWINLLANIHQNFLFSINLILEGSYKFLQTSKTQKNLSFILSLKSCHDLVEAIGPMSSSVISLNDIIENIFQRGSKNEKFKIINIVIHLRYFLVVHLEQSNRESFENVLLDELLVWERNVDVSKLSLVLIHVLFVVAITASVSHFPTLINDGFEQTNSSKTNFFTFLLSWDLFNSLGLHHNSQKILKTTFLFLSLKIKQMFNICAFFGWKIKN